MLHAKTMHCSASSLPKVIRTWCALCILTSTSLCATTACNFWSSQLPTVVRSWCALYILASTCAWHHNTVHLLGISTSNSVPDLVRFVHFDFDMCFAPRRRAIFRHLNFHKKCSGAGVCFVHVVLCTTRVCTCSVSQLPRVLRTWCACAF